MDKPFEAAFTILVAFTAVVAAGLAYQSANYQIKGGDADNEAMVAVIEANSLANSADAEYVADMGYWTQADIAQYDGDVELARYLRSQTLLVDSGYFNADGNVMPEFATEEDAWAAYDDELYIAYGEMWEEVDMHFEEGDEADKISLNFLMGTVIVGIATMMGTIGMVSGRPGIRRVYLVMVGATIVGDWVCCCVVIITPNGGEFILQRFFR